MNYHGWLHNIGMLQIYREALKMQVHQRKFVFLLHIQSAALHLISGAKEQQFHQARDCLRSVKRWATLPRPDISKKTDKDNINCAVLKKKNVMATVVLKCYQNGSLKSPCIIASITVDWAVLRSGSSDMISSDSVMPCKVPQRPKRQPENSSSQRKSSPSSKSVHFLETDRQSA